MPLSALYGAGADFKFAHQIVSQLTDHVTLHLVDLRQANFRSRLSSLVSPEKDVRLNPGNLAALAGTMGKWVDSCVASPGVYPVKSLAVSNIREPWSVIEAALKICRLQ